MLVSWIAKVPRKCILDWRLRRSPCDLTLSIYSSFSDSSQNASVDPFSIVAEDLSLISKRLRSMVTAEELSTSSKSEQKEKKLVPRFDTLPNKFSWTPIFNSFMILTLDSSAQVLLLMAKSFNSVMSDAPHALADSLTTDLRERQNRIAEITEIIHVASLIHDDVIDEANTRRGMDSLNFLKGSKLAVLVGNFLLSRAFVALASLNKPEVVSLMATAINDLVAGETMQMTATSDKCCSMELYMQKTYNKTASLISNSCKAIALVSGQSAEVANVAFEYGKHLGLAYQMIDDILDFTGTSASLGKASLSDIRHGIITAPLLFAMEEFPHLQEIVNRGFDDPTNLDLVLEYLKKSSGIQRTKELAMKHSALAAAAIDSLPVTIDKDTMTSRQALKYLAQRVVTRKK